LGIGGEDLKEALHNNLYVLNQEGLYNEVIKKFSMEEIELDCEAGLEPCSVVVEAEPEKDLVEELEECAEEVEEMETSGDLLSVQQAADHYGCTYSNIYNYVKGGKLEYREIGPRKRKKINKDVLAAFMDERKGKRGRKAL